MFFTKDDRKDEIASNVDNYNDSYARDVTPEELRIIIEEAKIKNESIDDTEIAQLSESLVTEAQELAASTGGQEEFPPGWLFKGLTINFHDPSSSDNHRLWLAQKLTEFGGANTANSLDDDEAPTHVVVGHNTSEQISATRKTLSERQMSRSRGLKIPYLVTVEWIEQSWKEKTLLDEESMFSTPSYSVIHDWK
jgi:DNA ligase 4